jgi:glycosyltransferase involved in cell wall biosynthesis
VLATSNTLLPPFNLPDMPVMRQPPSQATRRVLHLRTVTGRGGGPEKTILNSPRYIGPGYEMRLAFFRPRDDAEFDLHSRAKQLNVSLVDIPEKGPIDVSAIRQLRLEIRKFRPHILHPHDYKTNVLGLIFGSLYHIPVVTTLHGYGVRSRRLSLYYQVDRICLRWLHHVIVVSEEIEALVRSWRVHASRCTLVHNAIDSEAYCRRETTSEAKARLKLPARRFVIGAIGRLSKEKAFHHLISAVDRLIGEGHDLELLIAGDGPDRARLERCIATAVHASRLKLLGHRLDVIDVLSTFDAFVLPSESEGLPNVVLEAMAMEVPVLCTRVGAIPNVISDGQNGVLLPSNSADSIITALRELIDSPERRRQMGAAGRRTVVERFSFQRRMEKIRHIYESVLAERTSGRSVGRNGSHD